MKKLLTFCVALLFLLPNGVLLCGAAAEEVRTVTVDMGVVEAVQFDPRTTAPAADGNFGFANSFFAADADTPYTFYMYLTQRQKDVYNAVLQAGIASADNVNGVAVTFSQPITCDNATLALDTAAANELQNAVAGGLSALMDDHPELFWIGGFSYSYSISYYYSDGLYHITVKKLTCIISYDTAAYADQAAVTDYYNRMMEAYNAFPVEGFTRYEKVKSIHDNIAKQVAYDSSFTNPTAHQPTSVFLEPYLPVCEGYAEAFKMLCDREGIPCVVVVGNANGGGHAWNYVKMEDGKWYAVDNTWDDQGAYVFYDFFLVGADATNLYFDGDDTTFASSHTPTGVHYPSIDFALPYPTLANDSYSKMMVNRNADATVKKANHIVLVGKTQTLSSAFSTPFGYTLSVSGNTTGGTLTVSANGTAVETYTVARRGDVVADNTVNATDYNKIVQTAIGAQSITDKAQTAAADMNSDGVVDAFDAALLDLYLNGYEIY